MAGALVCAAVMGCESSNPGLTCGAGTHEDHGSCVADRLDGGAPDAPPAGDPVAAPVFSPSAGQVAAGTVVTVSTATPGATIYVGSTSPPTTPGTTFTVSTAGTWYARATLAGRADSPVATASYTLTSAGTRPAYNTGTGFFVADGVLHDATGAEFRVRGVNKAHYDVDQTTGALSDMKANAVRWALYEQAATLTQQVGVCQKFIDNKMVPIPGSWDGTGDQTAAKLSSIVDTWVAQASSWIAFEKYAIINIANEWGPEDSTVWRDAYVAAVARLRQAGYLHTLMVDAGGWGQGAASLVHYAQEVFDSDPQKNVVFSFHVYGNFSKPATETWQQDYDTAMSNLAALGLPLVIGEFGPGRDIGPSPTTITPGTIIGTADDHGWGWLAWAADDNNLPDSKCNDDWFCLLYDSYGPGTTANLTIFGKDVVENATYGLKARAQTAQVFE